MVYTPHSEGIETSCKDFEAVEALFHLSGYLIAKTEKYCLLEVHIPSMKDNYIS
jgi:hypothetical protein